VSPKVNVIKLFVTNTVEEDAATLSIMTLSITTLSIMTLSLNNIQY